MNSKIPERSSMENQIVEAQMQQLGLTNSYGNQNMVNPNVKQGVNKNTLTSTNSYPNQIPVIPNQIMLFLIKFLFIL
jgi:nitrate reductase cytochrome c-type subunit